ncbi:hypothetical protein [Actinokineospora fastidiosa]|nr:hypothetical protein [Actinokineospora fastidiosa]
MTTTLTRATPVRFRLSTTARRTWLLTHIAAAGIWLGIDVVLAILVGTALLTSDPILTESAFRALEVFAVGPLIAVSLITFGTGVVLGWGTKYGLVRYWWVAVKLGLNTILTLLIIFGLSPTLHETATMAAVYATDGAPDISGLVAPPIVSTTAVLAATALSVFKPWGRIRRPA